MTVINLTLEVRHYYYVHCTPGTCNTGRLPGKSLLSPPAPEEKKTLLTARPSDSADPERGWARGDFWFWAQFLRKSVKYRDTHPNINPFRPETARSKSTSSNTSKKDYKISFWGQFASIITD